MVYPRPDLLAGSTAKVALRNVTLELRHGQIFGLLGHNGSGKTTLVSILCGLRAPTQGSVQVLGKAIGENLDDLRSNMGAALARSIEDTPQPRG